MRSFLFAVMIGLSFFVFPTFALAQATKIPPELNPLCWKKDDCAAERAKFTRKDSSDMKNDKDKREGFVTGEEPCAGADWGKCLPAGKTTTEISFGGKREFSNVGTFIQIMYRYAIGVAAIIAVAMIIVAGMQWVTSGGNSEAITSAKKRIAGAMMGLFLAYMSYFILSSLNPALVSFRLPQVFMVRTGALLPQFCEVASSTTQFALATEKEDQVSKPVLPGNLNYNVNNKDKPVWEKEMACGRRFFVKDGGEQTCFGNICQSGNICTEIHDDGTIGNKGCLQAAIVGRITNEKFTDSGCLAAVASPFSAEGWETPEIVDTAFKHSDGEHELWIACKDGSMNEVKAANNKTYTLSDFQNYYAVASGLVIDSAANQCGAGGAKGMVIKFEMNEDCDSKDENHWIGYAGDSAGGNYRAKDLGDDEFFKKKAKDISQQYFIPIDVAKKGMRLDMFAASDIYDIDCPGAVDGAACDAKRTSLYGDLLMK
ncbi:MAG: hypothetical protein EXS55_00705 [Candidatus Magasanikbacteria bacterium]|nr:hypothetical protein [Candidatus Magasanikbacteria bacterium]